MSVTNGLGTLQNLLSNLATTASRDATKTTGATSNQANGITSGGIGYGDGAKISSGSALVAGSLGGQDVRAGKVAFLQGAIAAGIYTPSAADVAGKVVDTLLQ